MPSPLPEKQGGMIYIVLLLAVAMMGGASAVSLQVAQTTQARSNEAALLAIGLEFRRALQSYAEATPMGFPTNPESLEELLRDPRHPGVLRHLRRIYPDPFTGKTTWGLIRGPDRRIVAIHSLSTGTTYKRENFPPELESLQGQAHHSEWLFSIATMTQAHPK